MSFEFTPKPLLKEILRLVDEKKGKQKPPEVPDLVRHRSRTCCGSSGGSGLLRGTKAENTPSDDFNLLNDNNLVEMSLNF